MGYIQEKLENYKRKQAIKKITEGLGKITEDETTIYCHVDEKIIKEDCNYGEIYGFNLNHFPVYAFGTKYFLQKNIVYIFEGISFYKPVTFYISSPKNTHSCIKFQNCTFTERITIGEAENVEFINNRSLSYITNLLVKKGVNNLKFINDNILTSAAFSDRTYIDINCDTLEMNNTDFDSDSSKIIVKNLTMKNSYICSYDKIEITAEHILLENSEINSLEDMELNTKECNDFSSIKADNIVYNGLSLNEHNNSYEEIDNLIEARQSLMDTLATIKVNEENYQKEEASRYKKELKNLPLTRRLTKKNT